MNEWTKKILEKSIMKDILHRRDNKEKGIIIRFYDTVI